MLFRLCEGNKKSLHDTFASYKKEAPRPLNTQFTERLNGRERLSNARLHDSDDPQLFPSGNRTTLIYYTCIN